VSTRRRSESVEIIQKGYGEIKLAGGESVLGEITLYREGWLAVSPVPPDADAEVRWFPIARVAELVWRKSIAVRRP
jgi:hypothetical protein